MTYSFLCGQYWMPIETLTSDHFDPIHIVRIALVRFGDDSVAVESLGEKFNVISGHRGVRTALDFVSLRSQSRHSARRGLSNGSDQSCYHLMSRLRRSLHPAARPQNPLQSHSRLHRQISSRLRSDLHTGLNRYSLRCVALQVQFSCRQNRVKFEYLGRELNTFF